jgi:t-SNARE complex subunit (syntaxin)
LVAIESQERDRLQTFKAEIETVRNKYLEEIKKLSESAKHSKEQIEAKVTPLLRRQLRSGRRLRLQP